MTEAFGASLLSIVKCTCFSALQGVWELSMTHKEKDAKDSYARMMKSFYLVFLKSKMCPIF